MNEKGFAKWLVYSLKNISVNVTKVGVVSQKRAIISGYCLIWIAIIGGYEMKDIDVILLDKKLAIEEAKNERLKANQDYIAMMTDVEIPEEEYHEQEFSEG